ncbi:uncharacterized protein L3040_007650 [Drepanopeziza brunnea f. sp. 'multigermtubi']|uniref:uncharacterized protein n=1 Tax=Drepanopeziza brunnea f. sp. 'multigermtubi' TaxID=698441 RepID=UPI002398947D|nr:hypothetical protein L3040_007650 [Drepanopeziza brunnea f. sp. 'multigermtubi']
MAGDRWTSDHPSQPNPRQNRYSTQTDAPTISTQSPFASPIASEFRGDGLAPRPSSFQPGTSDAAYNGDYLEKRRRRQSREQYEDPSSAPPPAAPEVPRAPPLSYKQPYSNAGGSQALGRSRSKRRSEGPVGSRPENYGIEEGANANRREPNNGKGAVPFSGSRRKGSISQPRKSSLSEAEELRRREWAPDRSPLQRLELTLDSITKEEKRARVEEAEVLARESKASRGGERPIQNSVRFRNRPVAKAPEPISQPELARKLRTKQKDQLQRSGTVEIRTSTRDPTHLPAAAAAAAAGDTGVSRSGSNKLRKKPPGDLWVDQRLEAEEQYPTIAATRKQSFDSRQQPATGRPARNHSQSIIDKELPVLPRDAAQNPAQDNEINLLDFDSFEKTGKPVRNGTLSKLERLTGSSNPPVRTVPAGDDIRAKRVVVNGGQYDVPPTATGPAPAPAIAHSTDYHHRLSKVFHQKHENIPGQGVYVPSRHFDEWKKGGVALLSGTLLDLGAKEQTEEEKDRAWWEAGNAGTRRRSSVKQRKAEAYDGEYDDNAPTRFKPPLFLKSGPMLRYCGLRNDKVKSRSNPNKVMADREIWRGSIMIVSQDQHSSYELAPTLRLFLQPVDLLPPPPAQFDGRIDDLAPEYVDPLAGLPKLGRDGRTLYIRPIDHLPEVKDLSREESDDGLFEMSRSPLDGTADRNPACKKSHYDGEKAGKYKEVRGFRLHAEHGMTFWRFNIEIELREKQQRIAYRINRGPATGFWVPARGKAMNIMFSSCNGFSHDVDPNLFCGPDPMWRDVLNTHQTQPFHVMLGGGDQIYNDRVMEETVIFKQWLDLKDRHHKEKLPFTPELQRELELFYLNRYSMWFSQGLFGVAVSQIPMINIYDDHDIIDGFGSYPNSYMCCPIFSGLGSVAFKYYMLFQHQSSIDEGEETEPSWILGTQPGPYIKELSRSIFTTLGREIAFLGLDCRTERMYDEIVSAETYHKIFDRLEKEIIKGETKHLIVLVGVPVAYPRLVWLENILTSRLMEPVKALSRAGVLGKKLLNHMDGGVEILDDLDDHWTAKHHKEERKWFIQELQDLAAIKSVRVTLLGGDVHLGAIGQFYSNPQLGIPKDKDFRYMPNVISSAIANSPPPDTLADLLNKRNKVHHLDAETDEDMIPIFTHDVNGKPRNNKRLLNRRNWCSIRLYDPELTPPPTPQSDGPPSPPPRDGLLRRLSTSARGPSYRPDATKPPSRAGIVGKRQTTAPPISNPGFFARRNSTSRRASTDSGRPPSVLTRTLSLSRKDFIPGNLFRRDSKRKKPDSGGINGYGASSDEEDSYYYEPQAHRSGLRGGSGGRNSNDDEGYFPSMPAPTARVPTHPVSNAPTSVAGSDAKQGLERMKFHRTPSGVSAKQMKKAPHLTRAVNIEGGLDVCLNMEVNPKDPAGITMPYRLLVPRLWHEEPLPAVRGESRSRGSSMERGSSESGSEWDGEAQLQQRQLGKPSRWEKFVGKGNSREV